MNQYAGHPDQKFGSITYSQHGDDLMLLNLFKLMDVKNPTWLDLGAHHPITISNTALLYAKGFSGFNVDANPNVESAFKQQRPRDRFLNVGVLPEPSSEYQLFYMYSDTSGRNTFSLEEVKTLENVLTIQKTLKVPTLTINQIMDSYLNNEWPDLLLTDIEGLDYDVLKSANFSNQSGTSSPKIIVTEARPQNSKPVKDLLTKRGYFCYCRMGENLFFIRQDFQEKVY